MNPTTERFAAVKQRVARACERVGRDPADVTIICVTKKHPASVIAGAQAAGIGHVGENYAQELRDKRAELGPSAEQLSWHFIGRLQRNKVKYVVGKAALIHAVDSQAVAEEIARRAVREGVVQDILVAVNTGGEEQKSGVAPDRVHDVIDGLDALDGLQVKGLMTMPPRATRPEDNRPYFRALARLRAELGASRPALKELSMGTTDDFEVAVEEGATLIRVGTAILGPRPG